MVGAVGMHPEHKFIIKSYRPNRGKNLPVEILGDCRWIRHIKCDNKLIHIAFYFTESFGSEICRLIGYYERLRHQLIFRDNFLNEASGVVGAAAGGVRYNDFNRLCRLPSGCASSGRNAKEEYRYQRPLY